MGPIRDAGGVSTNQLNLYSAKDAVAGAWIHDNGITGSGYWNFGAEDYRDSVEIVGNQGKLQFSVFGEAPVILQTEKSSDSFMIENPKHIQYYHVENIRKDLAGIQTHPSKGESATHTAWVMDKILGRA